MVSAIKLCRKRILVLALLLASFAAKTQVSITGPTCVVNGTQYQYTISGSWNGSTSMTWCITGGYIVNNGGGSCKSGTPLPSVQVIFNTGTSGSVALTSSIGNSTKNVTITSALSAGTITANQTQTIPNNTIPGTISCSAASGGACTPSFSYQWEQSPDNLNWTNISGATSLNLSFSSGVTQTTYYRRKVTETTSGTIAYSASATVFIATPLQSGSISGGTSPITYNTSPGQMTCGVASGGICGGSYSYQWQQSPDNTTFSNISGATSLTYTPGNLTQTTYYRMKVVCGSETAYSAVKTIIVAFQLVPGEIITGDQLIAYNSIPITINASLATYGNCGSYIYQWQSSTDNIAFTDLSGSTSANLTFSTGLTQTKYYRRKVTCGGAIKYTFSVKVQVGAVLSPGSASGAQTIPYNTIPGPITGTDASGGICSGIYLHQWQQSIDGTNFTDISEASALNLGVIIPLTQTTFYRRKVTCGTETGYTSNIQVSIGFSPGILTSSQGINSGSAPAAFQVGSMGGGSCGASYTYQWEKSTDGYNWSVISGAASANYTSGTLTVTTAYRVKVTCSSISSYTNAIKVKILGASGTNIPVTSGATSSATLIAMPSYASGIDPNNQNYIRTRAFFKPGISDLTTANAQTDKFDVSQSTEYFDGVGRPVQSVTKQSTPLGKDIVSTSWYDIAGRVVQKYLPYTDALTSGNFRTDAQTQQPGFYNTFFNNTESFYYSNATYEISPLNRVIRESTPGKSWSGSDRGVRSEERSNLSSEDVKIWSIGYSTGAMPSLSGSYAIGELYVKITTDEQENQTIEYKDKEGNVILKKVLLADNYSVAHTGWLCTYYVYDELSRLRFVIPPKAVDYLSVNSWVLTTAVSNDLCFRYEYDSRARMIVKKVPGSAEVHTVYDIRDRLVMTQDGKLLAATQWSVSKYDDQNRPLKIGIITSASNRATHQSSATANITYPTLNDADVYTQNYYDDYSWTSGITGISATMSTTDINSTNFITTYNVYPVYAQQIISTAVTRGIITGTKTRVIGSTTYLYNVSFYDEKGRQVQTQTTNINGGTDYSTAQYGHSGRKLRTHLKHNNPLSTLSPTTKILSKMQYDHAGRLIKIWKQINDSGIDKLTLENDYDELSQLKNKKLGKQSDGITPLETLAHEYNIRGWLQSINKDYANNTSNSNWFGQTLNYDFGFTAKLFNGNIAGLKWRSKGDGEQRAFGFGYDNASRLTKGDFTQYTSSAWNISAGFDFSVSNLTYDLNGNILTMNQKGWKLSGSALIDQMSYTYESTTTNKLKQVIDAVNDNNSKLGDFKYDATTKTATDYSYDVNGNLTLDNNKKISLIAYNHLNLPSIITVTGKGTITYTYDATGNKLKKLTSDITIAGKTITTTTIYIGGFVYESKQTTPPNTPNDDYTNKLQFAGHEEGRIRALYDNPAPPNTITGFALDYFIKDHLGNVRMVLTDEVKQDQYPAATLEGTYSATSPDAASMINYEKKFYTTNNTYVVNSSTMPGWTTGKDYQNNNGNPPPNSSYPSGTTPAATVISAKVYKLNATTNKTGLGMVLKVMAGDKIDIHGKSYYQSATTYNNSNSTVLTLGDVIGAFIGSPDNAGFIGKGITSPTMQIINTGLVPATFFRGNDGTSSSIPKAYVNYILFDEQFKYAGGGFSRAGSSGTVKNHWFVDAALQNIPVTKNGYLYVYVSNESNDNVFFDNLQVFHTRGALLEETHYYPFGLTMSGISSKALAFGSPENKKKFNDGSELANKEFSDGSGLELYETNYRSLDPQLGRFWQIDPMADFSFEFSPYAYGNNNPILLNDPLGLMSDSTHPVVLPEVVVVSKPKLKGGQYNGIPFSEIQQKFEHGYGYSRLIEKEFIPHDRVNSAFQEWIAELNKLSKLYGYGAALAGGSVLNVKSLKKYKEFFKRLIKEGKIKVSNPALLALATIMGIRSDQIKNQAEALVNILIDYGIVHATEGTKGKGIYVITDSFSVGTLAGWGATTTTSFYDASSKKFIGSTYEHY